MPLSNISNIYIVKPNKVILKKGNSLHIFIKILYRYNNYYIENEEIKDLYY